MERLGVDFDDEAWPNVSFAQAQSLFLERIASTPLNQLDSVHLEMFDAVLHMGYTLDGCLVQVILGPDGELPLGHERIDSDTEKGLAYVLISVVNTLDEEHG